MKCQTCFEALTAFMDGELLGGQDQEIDQHLEQCPDCRQEHDSLLKVRQWTQRLPAMEVNPFLWNRIQAEIVPGDAMSRSFWRFPFLRPAWLAVAATVVLVATAFYSGWLNPVREPTEGLEADFRVFIEQRQKMRARHVRILSGPAGARIEQIHSNPFAERIHREGRNPFRSETPR